MLQPSSRSGMLPGLLFGIWQHLYAHLLILRSQKAMMREFLTADSG
ncbi:hypothetical protein [Acinetobacter bouvetii]|nr:hypothetical protein [Acinetobacter bouvetii]